MTAIPHILLVKDDENDVFFLRLAFAGEELHVARDGREALEYLRVGEQDPLPALVLLGLKIPYVSG